MDTQEKDKRVYELGYIVIPTLREEDVVEEEKSLKEFIASLGGEIISEEAANMIDLQYQMEKTIANKKQKFNEGYFGWVKFEVIPEAALELKAKLDLSQTVLRFMILKTVRENTYLPKKPLARAESRRKSSEHEDIGTDEVVSSDVAPVSEETVNKEIEALVVE